MTGSVVLVADAGKDAGLGHIGRSSAVAVALRCRQIETASYALEADRRLTFDGIDWAPLSVDDFPPKTGDVMVVDSYRLSNETLQRVDDLDRVVVMHDAGPLPEGAALVVSVASSSGVGRLGGLEYAALRPAYWGLAPRRVNERVEHVLVTTGSGQFAEAGAELAQSLADTLPEATVTLVRGPYAGIEARPGVAMLDRPDSLLEPMLGADLVVSAAGQTMLEAAAAGTPCVVLVLAENQRRQAERLTELGSVALLDPPHGEEVLRACSELADDAEARRQLSRNGQLAVDGYGALRIAFEIARLATS